MIWVVVVAFEAVREDGAFALVTSLFLVVRRSLTCKDTRDEGSGGGGWSSAKEVWLDARVNCRISQVLLHIEELLVCITFFVV